MTPEEKKQEHLDMKAMVLTLAESEGPVPNSVVYLALGMDLDRYHRLVAASNRLGILVEECDMVKLSSKGREMSKSFDSPAAAGTLKTKQEAA